MPSSSAASARRRRRSGHPASASPSTRRPARTRRARSRRRAVMRPSPENTGRLRGGRSVRAFSSDSGRGPNRRRYETTPSDCQYSPSFGSNSRARPACLGAAGIPHAGFGAVGQQIGQPPLVPTCSGSSAASFSPEGHRPAEMRFGVCSPPRWNNTAPNPARRKPARPGNVGHRGHRRRVSPPGRQPSGRPPPPPLAQPARAGVRPAVRDSSPHSLIFGIRGLSAAKESSSSNARR